MGAGALGLDTMQNEFSTRRMRVVWGDKNRVEKICLVERTVAKVQAELGMIPKEAAEQIDEYCRPEYIDERKLHMAGARAGHFLSGFVIYMQEIIGEAGQYLHYGVASQDILDTAMLLQLQDAHAIIVDGVEKIAVRSYELAEQYKEQIMSARGHGTQSPPTTLGFEVATYLDEFDRLLRQLKNEEEFVFSSSIAGVVGTYASLGEKGPEVEKKVLKTLGLYTPSSFTHPQRSRFVEYSHSLTMLSGVLERIGKNLFDLSRTEINEFSESYGKQRQASTTLPGKRNPYTAEAVVNLGELIKNQMALMYDALSPRGVKETITWRNIWSALPNICMYLSAQLNYTYALIKSGDFKTDNMESNLAIDGGTKMSENVMLRLGEKIGKQNAHQVVYTLADQVIEKNTSFMEEARASEDLQQHFTGAEIDQMLNPYDYLGYAVENTERVLRQFKVHHPNLV